MTTVTDARDEYNVFILSKPCWRAHASPRLVAWAFASQRVPAPNLSAKDKRNPNKNEAKIPGGFVEIPGADGALQVLLLKQVN